MFPPLSIASFYAITTMNGYHQLSDSLYYSSAAITAISTFIKGISMENKLPLKIKLGSSLLGASLGTALTACMGHNTGRAIREITSFPANPSSLHNDALYFAHPSRHSPANSHSEDSAPLR